MRSCTRPPAVSIARAALARAADSSQLVMPLGPSKATPSVWPLIETRLCGALPEHGAAVLVDELDAQALRRVVDHHLFGEHRDVGIVLDRLVDRFGRRREVAVLRRRVAVRVRRAAGATGGRYRRRTAM